LYTSTLNNTDLWIQSLQNKRVLSIDLSAILAGSGIRGQFEEKFKALIRDIEAEASRSLYQIPWELIASVAQGGNVICFIDEVRT